MLPAAREAATRNGQTGAAANRGRGRRKKRKKGVGDTAAWLAVSNVAGGEVADGGASKIGGHSHGRSSGE